MMISPLAYAQVSNPSIQPSASAPSGACTQTLPLTLKTPDGTLYSCQNGTWGTVGGGGTGTVSTVSVVTANGVSGSVANPTTTPAITLTLGAITPSSVTIPSDGVHAQQLSLVGQTTAPTIPANASGFIGPPSASFTSYFVQLPSTAPTAGQVLAATAPVAGLATGSWVSAPVTIASGTSAMGTSGITTGTCASVVTTSATGVATTDVIQYTPNADPTGVTGYAVSATGSLYIWAYPTANNVNFRVCNNTSGTLTPSALTLNWKVVR